MSELILIGYPDEDAARDVWHKLVALERDFLIDLDDAAVIRRDARGHVHVTAPAHHGVARGTLSGFFWGTVIGMVLLPLIPLFSVAGGLMGAAMGVASDLGIKEDFRKQARDLLPPGTSAIFVMVRKANPEKVLEAIRPFGGIVLRSSLPDAFDEQLMKALHGDDWAAAATREHSVPPADAGGLGPVGSRSGAGLGLQRSGRGPDSRSLSAAEGHVPGFAASACCSGALQRVASWCFHDRVPLAGRR